MHERSGTVERVCKTPLQHFPSIVVAPTPPAYECRKSDARITAIKCRGRITSLLICGGPQWQEYCARSVEHRWTKKSIVADRKPTREWLITHESPSATGIYTQMRPVKPLSSLFEISWREKQLENYVCWICSRKISSLRLAETLLERA